MLPLILLALGLGAALTVYEFSPRTRSRVDAYVRAIREAHEAHRAADRHLSEAHAGATGPAEQAAVEQAAVEHAAAAVDANRIAAQSTAVAAAHATTPAEKSAAARSAEAVLAREEKIASALADLGIGQCGVRTYAGVGSAARAALLTRLQAEGMIVTGNNPWDIDTGKYDVKLRAAWDPGAQVLKLVVTAGKGGYFGLVTCEEIWGKIDPIMRGIIG